jgi:hypothetical protein
MEKPKEQPKIKGVVDTFYEHWVCEKLLDLSRILYLSSTDQKFPTGAEVMAQKEQQTPEQIRVQMLENIDFLSVSLKYMMFDKEAMLRERKKLLIEFEKLKKGK